MGDIATRGDIEALLVDFYSVVMADPEIGFHFDELDLEAHLPVITDFWEKVLFGNPVYFNNPLAVHFRLHERAPLLPGHFERWVEVFGNSVDKFYSGPVADAAKQRAAVIANNMSSRLNGTAAQRTR